MMQEGPARQMQEFKDFGQKESRCAAPAETAVYKTSARYKTCKSVHKSKVFLEVVGATTSRW